MPYFSCNVAEIDKKRLIVGRGLLSFNQASLRFLESLMLQGIACYAARITHRCLSDLAHLPKTQSNCLSFKLRMSSAASISPLRQSRY